MTKPILHALVTSPLAASKSIAEKLEYLINNEQRCLDLIRLGTENVKRFDIKVIAEQLKKVIESE